MNRKAVIYCRVSSKAQESEGHGLQSQETRCRQYAEIKGYDVAVVFPDTVTGGGDFMQRPGMVALLSFLDAQPDERFVVIFDDLKRFARDTRFHLDLRDAFRKRGATIECLNYKFDDTPEGEFVETILAAQGALERKQNGRQVAQKMKARMQNGYWIHTAPIGFRYETFEGRGKMLVPNPPFDGIIREAFEGYASGRFRTQAEVKRFFESFPDFPRNKHGEVKQQRVSDILSHSAYTGHICSENYGISWLKGRHTPLISLETFDKVQERRAGSVKAPKRANIGDAFALRGIVTCACCDVPLRSSVSKGNGGFYPYYLCQTKGCEAYGKSIKRDTLENDVGNIIKTLQPTRDVITMAKAMFRVAWEQRRTQAQDILRSGKRQLTALDKEIDTVLQRIMQASNATVIRSYEDRVAKLERDKAVLAENLAKQAEPKGSFEEKLEPALTFLANPWKLWETPGKIQIHLRRLVLKLAFTGPIKYCRIEGTRTTGTALLFKALGDELPPKVLCGAG
ncbi:recombinase family protein, partial [Ascidiaceihabitans sp.]|uniref:recombinase family protein n=1 Tax=Ascidiaceihabitans sp. TaxID=1872644 RepID=UPI0032978993